MIIASQNLTNFNISLPDDTIYRINLAWVDNLSMLESILKKHHDREIFLDLPRNRTKPPNNKYSIEELKPFLTNFKNIKFFAVSNVDSADDLKPFLEIIPENCIIIPKIESPLGVENIEKITSTLGAKKIIMLDHDDLYSSLIKSGKDTEKFQTYVKTLSEFCSQNQVTLLRTIGVLFGDQEKRISEYIK
tara:strand:+ start:2865 stop:3434 length:570 start_codon:yes stop_codon:yes gene_type:complete